MKHDAPHAVQAINVRQSLNVKTNRRSRGPARAAELTGPQRSALRPSFILFTGVSASFAGGLRGVPLGRFSRSKLAIAGACARAALAAVFVKSRGGSVLDGTALRTGTAGPPGRLVGAVATWPVVG